MRKLFKWVAILITLFGMYFVYNHYTYEFYYTNGEKHGMERVSPNGAYTAQAYALNYGGAAGGVNLYVNVTFHLEKDQERTVYFSDAKNNVLIQWVGDDTLSIANSDEYSDRSIELIVGKEVYDEHGGACGTYKVKKKYVCYSHSSNK